DFRNLEEFRLLGSNRTGERDEDTVCFGQRKEERHRVRRKVGLDSDDGARTDALAFEARAPVSDPFEEPVVTERSIAPDERVVLTVRLEDVEQELNHAMPPR